VLAYFKTDVMWGDLFKRTLEETQADNGLGLAAQLAYYFFLALFPALLFVIALAGVFAHQALVARTVEMLSATVPPDIVNIIRNQLTSLAEQPRGGIMTFGVIAALWSSSAAMVALIDALNRAYDVEDARPWWKQRLVAILLTIGVALFILVSFALVVFGPQLAETLAGRIALGAVFEWTWKIFQWPVVFVLVATAFSLVYYFAPDVEQDFVFLTPGSVFATLLWLVGSLGVRVYVTNFASYNETYGTVGGVMVLLVWLYISGLCVVAGAEMNAEIARASVRGKAPGEQVPGRKKVVGARTVRDVAGRQYHSTGSGLAAGAPPASGPARAGSFETFARIGVVVTGVVAALFGTRLKDQERR